MQFKDVNLKNIHTLPLAGIAFHRFDMESSQYRLLESIDAEMISVALMIANLQTMAKI